LMMGEKDDMHHCFEHPLIFFLVTVLVLA